MKNSRWNFNSRSGWIEFFDDMERNRVQFDGSPVVLSKIKEHANSVILDDKEIILRAVSYGMGIFKLISARLRNDIDVVVEALKCNNIFEFAGDDLKSCENSALKAIKVRGRSFVHCSKELRNDRYFVLKAVKLNGNCFQYLDNQLKDNKEVVLMAVGHNYRGFSLEYTSDRLKNDVEVVIEAVRRNGSDLKHASKELRNNKEVVLSACTHDIEAFSYIGDKLTNESPLLRKLKDFNGDIERSLDHCQHILRRNNIDVWEELFMKKLKDRKESWYDDEDSFRPEDVVEIEEKEKIDLQRECLKDKKFEDFVFHRELGSGAYGTTYLCRIVGASGVYVVKIFHDTSLGREVMDQRMSSDCIDISYHKNVVPILWNSKEETIDFSKLPDYQSYWRKKVNSAQIERSCMILMKYHRESLETFMKNVDFNFSQFDDDLFIPCVLRGIIEGACHLHEHMIVHRDIHFGNVFIDPEFGRVWIGDFGCCLDLRKNPTGFKVQKDDDILYTTLNSSGYFTLKACGGASIVPPEIENFDMTGKDEYRDYEKYDLFSIGVIGMMMVKKRYEKKVYDLRNSMPFKFAQKMTEKDPSIRMEYSEAKKEAIGIYKEAVIAKRRNLGSFDSIVTKESVDEQGQIWFENLRVPRNNHPSLHLPVIRDDFRSTSSKSSRNYQLNQFVGRNKRDVATQTGTI